MPTLTLCFYQSNSLPMWLERVFTRVPMQPLADVPSHCAGILPPEGWEPIQPNSAWEAIATGVHSIAAASALLDAETILLHATDEQIAKLWEFMRAQDGKSYDWHLIWADCLATFMPGLAAHFAETRTANHIERIEDTAKWDCSALWFAALAYAGFDMPEMVNPINPNQLKLWVKELARRQSLEAQSYPKAS